MFFKRTVRPNMGLPSVSSGHQTGATCKCILNSIQSSTMARYTSLATETRLGQPERPRKNRTADFSKYFRLEAASDVSEQHALTTPVQSGSQTQFLANRLDPSRYGDTRELTKPKTCHQNSVDEPVDEQDLSTLKRRYGIKTRDALRGKAFHRFSRSGPR